MNNKKGFTLTEVLLATMIVGVIGIALAALTTAAMRESGVGRSRLMLRNEISLFLRQLRQDVRESTSAIASEGQLKLGRSNRVGPDLGANDITYYCGSGTCTRDDGNVETVLNHVQQGTYGAWVSPQFVILNDGGSDAARSVLRVRIVVGMDSNPPIKEAVEETFMLPHGFSVTADH